MLKNSFEILFLFPKPYLWDVYTSNLIPNRMKKQQLLIVLSAFMDFSILFRQTRVLIPVGFFTSHFFTSQLILNSLKRTGYCVIEN